MSSANSKSLRRLPTTFQQDPPAAGRARVVEGLHMSKHREIGRTPRTSARQYMATGISGAALIGVGVLLAAHPGTPTDAAPEVQLASFGSAFAPPPLSPSTTTPSWLNGGGTGGSTGANGTGGNGGTGGGGCDGGPGSSGHIPGSGANTGTNHDGAEGGGAGGAGAPSA
jgi:hypothetical protein